MRRLLRPFWVLVALLFLLEAWLWDHLEPLVARAVNFIPWGRFKDWLKNAIADLPPWAALGVFIIPFIVLLPLKFLEVFFIAKRQWLAAAAVLIFAKLLGLGVTAFVFDATRGEAAPDGLVPADVRLVPMGARLGPCANRADPATAASIDLAVEAAARRKIPAAADAAAPPRLSQRRGVDAGTNAGQCEACVRKSKACGAHRPKAHSVSPAMPSAPESHASTVMPVMIVADASTIPIWKAAEANS